MTPTTRALISAARAGLDPDPGAAARVRAKLNLALGGAPAAAVAVPAAKAGLALKLAAVIVVAGAVIGIAVPKHTARATAVPAPVVDDSATVETPHVHIAAAVPERAPAAAPHHEHVAMPEAAQAHVADPQDVSLAREVELIDRAMTALRGGHADAALAAIATYHHETADRGQLLEDATAIDIEASCTLHLDVADKLAAFDQTWPSSAQRSRLTTACHR